MSVLPHYSAMENCGVPISEVDSFASPGKKWTLHLHISIQFSQGNSSRLFTSSPFQSLSLQVKQSIIIKSYQALTFCESDNGSCLLSIGFVHFFISLCLGGSKHDRTASNRKSCFMKHLTHTDKENIFLEVSNTFCELIWQTKTMESQIILCCNNYFLEDECKNAQNQPFSSNTYTHYCKFSLSPEQLQNGKIDNICISGIIWLPMAWYNKEIRCI
jgi:hypothetical protein